MLVLFDLVIRIYSLGLVVYILLGWLKSAHVDQVKLFMSRFYEPALSKIRMHAKPVQMGASMVDFSPAILLLGLMMLQGLLARLSPRGVN